MSGSPGLRGRAGAIVASMFLPRLWNRESLARVSRALLLGLVVAAAGLLVATTPAGQELEEHFGLGWMFGARGPVVPPSDVVIVAIDEQSSRDLGLPDRPSGWPRALHAELVRYLARAGAKVVAFDLTFDAPGLKPEQDQEFADAIRSAGNVLLAESLRRDTLRIQATPTGASTNAVIESRGAPIQVLEQAARGSAPFMLPKDSRVDTYWTFLDDSRKTPTLPVLTFQVFGREVFEGLFDSPEAPSAPSSSSDRSTAIPSQHGQWARRLDSPAARALPDESRRLGQTLIDLYTTAESQYLNFYGPPRTITTVSYSDVIGLARAPGVTRKGAVTDATFLGKAVFIGYAAATAAGQDRLRDDYRTVYSEANGIDLSGVEIAATAFANLVEGRVIRPVGPVWQLAIVVVWGLALGLVCRLARPIFATLMVIAASAVYLWIALERFADATLWLPSVIPVAMQTSLALFAGVWLSYRDTKREREGIKRAFGFFLPRTVVDQLSRNLGPMTHANQVLFGACLSTDAEKYTTLAEQTEPGRLGALMNEYYAQLFVPVERSQGVVADVVGDSMVAVWARTSSDIDVRRSACSATLEIARALEEFNESGGDRPPLLTRFGLHSGDMLFGSIGASEHYEYRAVGDIVNTASRIQGLNKVLGTRILASAESVQGLDEFSFRPLGSFLLAGKTKAVSIVELIGRRGVDRIDTGQDDLHRDFAAGLQAFVERRLPDAADAFARVLAVDPDDGPSRFYLGQCERLSLHPPAGEWSATLRIDSK